MNYDYIGATGISTTIDYIDMTSNTLNKRIDDIDLETSNISSNISIYYTNNLRQELWEVNPNNSNCLIKSKTYSGITNTHIINNNIDGEIRFNTLASAGFNLGGLDHNTKIDYLGRLKVYHNYDLTQPTILGGWYDVDYEIAQIKADGVNTDIQLSVLDASIVDIQAVQIPALSSALATYGELIGNTQAITESLTNELEWLITNDQISFIRNRTNNYNELVQSLAEVQDAPTNFITKTIQGAGDLLQIGTIGSIGFGLCAGFGALGEWIKLRNIASNITPSNFTITQSQRRQLIDSNTSNQILIMDDIFNNISNANIKKGFINSNISTIQFIPSLRSNKIIIGNDAPNTAYQLQLSGDANLNMLYLNNTSLQSLLNQKQGNLTFNNPILNTTNTITLKKDSSLTLDGSGNLSVVKTASIPLIYTGNNIALNYDTNTLTLTGGTTLTTIRNANNPLSWSSATINLNYDSTLGLNGTQLSVQKSSSLPLAYTGNNIALNYDSTLTLNGTQLSVASATGSKWTTSGTNIYNNNSGNVGINNQSPVEKLDVNGSIYSRSNLISGNQTSIISSYTVGTLNTITGTNNKYLLFNATGTLVLSGSLTCDILVVGGGGGGGGDIGGGGGAGGVVYQKNITLNAGTYSITVGAGGTGSAKTAGGGSWNSTNGGNGGDSFIQSGGADIVINSITYRGKGGGGGGNYNQEAPTVGRNGGSGGGGGGGLNTTGGIAGGTANQGNTYYNGTTNVAGGYNGSTNVSGFTYRAGGGGGAGSSANGGNGGNGVQIDITGTATWYAGGGGGGAIANTAGVGGNGVGGDGHKANPTVVATKHSGTNGTGSGGGGGGYPYTASDDNSGGVGGSGVVIIKFTDVANTNALIINNYSSVFKSKLSISPFTAITGSDNGFSLNLTDTLNSVNNNLLNFCSIGGASRLGINTTTPTKTLDIIGDARISGSIELTTITTTGLNINNGGLTVNTGGITSKNGATVGYSVLSSGGGDGYPGYVEFRNYNGTRYGYVGWNDGTGYLDLKSENTMNGYAMNGTLKVNSVRNAVGVWNYSQDGIARYHYGNGGNSFYRTGYEHVFRNSADEDVAKIGTTGYFTCRMESVANTGNDFVTVTVNTTQGFTYYETLKIAVGTFTGFHRCFLDDEDFNLTTEEEWLNFKKENEGRLVISTGKINTHYRNSDMPGWVEFKDKDGIFIEDALPMVKFSRTRKDKRIFGILGDGNRMNSSYKRLIIHGLGEGAIWVVNTNGNLENGDLLQSSNEMGYAEKADDDLIRNFTVGKITMDCDFTLDSPYYKCEVIDEVRDLRRAFVACIYMCS